MDKEKIAFEINKLLYARGNKGLYTKDEVIDLMIDSIVIGRSSHIDEVRETIGSLRDGLEKLSYKSFKKSLHNQNGCGNIK